MKFVVFHGSFGSPEDNWFPQLAENLESLGQKAIIPKFPVEDWQEITKKGTRFLPQKQNLTNWLKVFDQIRKEFEPVEKLCFIGHSLGPLFILHVVDKWDIKLDSAIFVSPFMEELKSQWQFDLVNRSFYKNDFDFAKLKKLIPTSYTLYSDNDPYVKEKLSIDFAKKLDSSLIKVNKGGHLNIEVNLNNFPLVLELCKTRLDLTLYQK